jgi:multidrug efflux system membrane fusion protein
MNLSTPLIGRATAAVALLAAIGLGAFVLMRLDQHPRTNDGFLFADTAALAFDVSGRVVNLLVKDNQLVHAGDELARVDPEPFELKLKEAQARVQSLRAQIDVQARQVASQSSGADAAVSQVARARAQLELARNSRERIEPLLGKGYATEQQVDEARTNERAAEDALTASMQQATQARKAVTDTQSLLAQLRGAEAQEALAQRDLRNTILRAPFDGKVVGLEVAEGTYALTGHPVFTLIDTSHWYAIANFRETDLRRVGIGDPSRIWLMADTGHALKGHVDSVGWGVRPENGGAPGLPSVNRSLNWVVDAQRFPVKVLIDNPPQQAMRMGATVSVMVRHDDAH